MAVNNNRRTHFNYSEAFSCQLLLIEFAVVLLVFIFIINLFWSLKFQAWFIVIAHWKEIVKFQGLPKPVLLLQRSPVVVLPSNENWNSQKSFLPRALPSQISSTSHYLQLQPILISYSRDKNNNFENKKKRFLRDETVRSFDRSCDSFNAEETLYTQIRVSEKYH